MKKGLRHHSDLLWWYAGLLRKLQSLPDEEGIETSHGKEPWTQASFTLQSLPDEEGIET